MNSIIIDGIEYRLFDHLYAVSHCGKVLKKLTPFTPWVRPDGYLTLGRRGLMHRIVAICWVENPSNANHVHHINGIKSDNRADNLEWVTPKEHFGERHLGTNGKHTLSDESKNKIRLSRLGTKLSEETKLKIKLSSIGKKHAPFDRLPHTKEWKENMSFNHPKNTGCKIYNISYRSFADASRELGINRFTIRQRCLSKNFPDYEIISF